MAAEVVYPSFLAQLAHQGIDPWEAGYAEFPALEPGFCFWGVDVVVACYEPVRWIQFRGEMPGDESAVGVADCLSEGVAQGRLRGEIHVPEEQLPDQVGGYGGLLSFEGFKNVHYAPVEEAHT